MSDPLQSLPNANDTANENSEPEAASIVPSLPFGPLPAPPDSIPTSARAAAESGPRHPLPGMGGASAAAKPLARRWWVWATGIAGVAVASILAAIVFAVEDLMIDNLQVVHQNFTFRLANISGRSGDVLLWVEQDEFRLCESIIHAEAHSSYNIALRCPTLQPGKLLLQAAWAEHDPAMAAIARRINPQ